MKETIRMITQKEIDVEVWKPFVGIMIREAIV